MKDKKFSFVLVHYSPTTLHLAELINASAMEEFGCEGIEEFSLEEARVDEILGQRAYSGGDVPESLIDEVQDATSAQEELTYKYFFTGENNLEQAHSFAHFLREEARELAHLIQQQDVEDWNNEWRKFYSPIKISPELEVVPEWLKKTYQSPSTHQVFIYPGMGFGTGTHETTYLCLKLFDQIREELAPHGRCLDFGCGSGILGIAVMKLMQMPTTFCDIDKSALDNCLQNLILNFEGQNLQGTNLVLRERMSLEQYDVIFANILDHVLKLEKEVILASLKPKAFLIVSGILNPQVESIISAYHELKKVHVLSKNDWSAIVFQRLI